VYHWLKRSTREREPFIRDDGDGDDDDDDNDNNNNNNVEQGPT